MFQIPKLNSALRQASGGPFIMIISACLYPINWAPRSEGLALLLVWAPTSLVKRLGDSKLKWCLLPGVILTTLGLITYCTSPSVTSVCVPVLCEMLLGYGINFGSTPQTGILADQNWHISGFVKRFEIAMQEQFWLSQNRLKRWIWTWDQYGLTMA